MIKSNTSTGTNARIVGRSLAALVVLAGMLTAGCGNSDEEAAAKAKLAEKAAAAQVASAEDAAAAAEAKKYAHLANAVITSKAAAPIDLKYDVLTKPDVGQPFEIEMTFQPRLPADSLEVEFIDMPGLALIGQHAVKFEKVVSGQAYTTRVGARADAAGLYYLNVIAKMNSQVQSEARTFSVPVVVGTAPAAAEKPAPQNDASGQPIQSMPAKES